MTVVSSALVDSSLSVAVDVARVVGATGVDVAVDIAVDVAVDVVAGVDVAVHIVVGVDANIASSGETLRPRACLIFIHDLIREQFPNRSLIREQFWI